MAKGDGEALTKAKADARHRNGRADGSGFGETLGVGEGLQGSQRHPGECQDLAKVFADGDPAPAVQEGEGGFQAGASGGVGCGVGVQGCNGRHGEDPAEEADGLRDASQRAHQRGGNGEAGATDADWARAKAMLSRIIRALHPAAG